MPFGLFAQNEIIGIGFIDLKLYKYLDEYNQDGGLDLYQRPGEEIVACLEDDSNGKYIFRKIIDNKGLDQELSKVKSGLISAEFGVYHADVLGCYEEKNGFVRVKMNDKNYWISLDDLAKEGSKFISWKVHFPNINGYMNVLYTMNLRTAPTINSDKIMVVRKIRGSRSLQLVKMTGNFEENWAEVNIHIWENGDYCENMNNSDHIIKGWIKHLDNKGFPNVFPINFRCC